MSGYTRRVDPRSRGLSDTSPEAQRRLAALYAAMTPQQKLDHALALTSAVQELVLGRIRMQHPEETNREHRIRMMSRWVPRELMIAAFEWDSAKRGR